MKFVSKDKPELIELYIDTLIEYINYKAPRVKCGERCSKNADDFAYGVVVSSDKNEIGFIM